MSEAVLGALILVPLVIVIYVVARFIAMAGDAWGASLLAPLAPPIGGVVSRDGPQITGSHRGHAVRVWIAPGQAVGSGETGFRMNAFNIEVLDQPGALDWRIAFRSTSWTSQAKDLFVETADTALGERIVAAGALDDVAAVSTPSLAYVTVAFDARRRLLTSTDDVSPRKVTTQADYLRQLDLAVHLAEINASVNPPPR